MLFSLQMFATYFIYIDKKNQNQIKTIKFIDVGFYFLYKTQWQDASTAVVLGIFKANQFCDWASAVIFADKRYELLKIESSVF